jgi:hypothetical protein
LSGDLAAVVSPGFSLRLIGAIAPSRLTSGIVLKSSRIRPVSLLDGYGVFQTRDAWPTAPPLAPTKVFGGGAAPEAFCDIPLYDVAALAMTN